MGFSSSPMANLLLLLIGSGITIIRYAVFGDLSASEWYVKVPVFLISDIGSSIALSGLFLLFVGNSVNGRLGGLHTGSTARDYSHKANASVSVYKGCNIAVFIISLVYLLLLCIMSSFDMFYLHIISAVILFFVVKNRSMLCCESNLYSGASLLLTEYSRRSRGRENESAVMVTENCELADKYTRELDRIGEHIPMNGDIDFSLDYIRDFPKTDFSRLSFRLFHGYKELFTKYSTYIEQEEMKNNAEEKIHHNLCSVLMNIRTMLMQEYCTIVIQKPEGMPDSSYTELLSLTKGLRNDVLELMLQQREALAKRFYGLIDTDIQDTILNHNSLFNKARNCIVPMLTYYRGKSQYQTALINQLHQKERK